MEREKREDINEHCHDDLQQVSGWSPWYPAILPHPPKKATRDYKPRNEGSEGYYSVFLLNETSENNPLVGCGVYEFMVETFRQRYAVYIGSTCRRRRSKEHGLCPNCGKIESHVCSDASLCERVGEYLLHGSHKRDLINAAVQQKCTVYIRARRFRSSVSDEISRKESQAFEDSLLGKYNYAWNRREPGNGTKQMRDVPPGMMKTVLQDETERRDKQETETTSEDERDENV